MPSSQAATCSLALLELKGEAEKVIHPLLADTRGNYDSKVNGIQRVGALEDKMDSKLTGSHAAQAQPEHQGGQLLLATALQSYTTRKRFGSRPRSGETCDT